MRAKKTLTSAVDRTGAEEAFALYATADAREEQITAEMDLEFTKIREKYQKELTDLAEIKETNFDLIQGYAENNRADFEPKKSILLSHGTIGFRTGTPAMKTKKGFTWESVKALLKTHKYKQYIRTVESVDKEKMLVDRKEKKAIAMFEKVGVSVVQDETFFVEPKKETVEASVN